jgi:hypothetical protein
MRQFAFRLFGALLVAVASSATASAAELITPKGSRIGIEPPPGFVPSATFSGFIDPTDKASITLTELPAPGGLDELRRGLSADAVAQHGMRLLATEKLDKLPYDNLAARAEQSVGDEVYDKWLLFFDGREFVGLVTVTVAKSSRVTDAVVRTALESIRISAGPSGDPVAALPFSIAPASRFKYRLPVGGRSLMLKETPPPPQGEIDDVMFVTTLAGDTPIAAADQRRFGEQQFLASRAIADKTIVSTKPVEIAGASGFEYLGQGKQASGRSRRYLVVVLYPAGRPVVMMGSALSERFDEVLPEFHAMVESFRSKL